MFFRVGSMNEELKWIRFFWKEKTLVRLFVAKKEMFLFEVMKWLPAQKQTLADTNRTIAKNVQTISTQILTQNYSKENNQLKI